MKGTRHRLTRSVILSAVLLAPVSLLHAKDEEDVAQVYLEFDPETGELKSTAADADTRAMNHAQSLELQNMQDGQSADAAPGIGSTTLLAIVIAAGALVAAVLIRKRRRSKGPS